jgi:hypothetical protein
VLYLASAKSNFTTGSMLMVDGGMSACASPHGLPRRPRNKVRRSGEGPLRSGRRGPGD